MDDVHGGVKFYNGAAKAARAYVERDRSRADDYYLGEGSGVAERLVATPDGVDRAGSMDGDTYEQWVAGIDVDTGAEKGRLRSDAKGLRFVEVVVNGPKTWSLAAALNPEISAALDAAQDKAAAEIVGWLAQHATTRVGPRGRQVQVPVEQVEAAVIRHCTSRAGDPHRHVHLQVNARAKAAGAWRGIHSVGIRDSIEAINGIGHAAVATDPEFRRVLAAHGFTMDPDTNELRELAPFIGAFCGAVGADPPPRRPLRGRLACRAPRPGARASAAGVLGPAGVGRGAPGQGRPGRWGGAGGPVERRAARPRLPRSRGPVQLRGTMPGQVDRDTVADLVVSVLGARRSAWNAADVRGGVEGLLAQVCVVADASVRVELAEDITARAVDRCVPLLARSDVPEHVRSLTSPRVLEVEADLIARLARRSVDPARRVRLAGRGLVRIDPTQAAVAGALAGTGQLVVVEGAAGAGKTTALRTTRELLAERGRRMIVVTPTLKAAEVAAAETGAEGHSASWLIHQHGWRWDDDGRWTRVPDPAPDRTARLRAGDLLLVDEAGMLDQDTAHALLVIADETGARIALVGDRHQLPAVGRGGVLDHAAAFAHPTAVVTLETVHRFIDPAYAALSLRMRTGDDPAAVFDTLVERGQIVLYPSEVDRTAALAEAGAAGELVIADTRDQVTDLNATIRDQRNEGVLGAVVTTAAGERIGLGDRVATRRNDPALGVANRQTWSVAGIDVDGSMRLHGRGRDRTVPAEYAHRHVELAFATTVHGAQGDTMPAAHVVIGEHTGAAAAYVAMTRGRDDNTAHLVAGDLDDARRQWVEVFARDRADLGPDHARRHAIDAIERYGPDGRRRPAPTAPPRAPAPAASVDYGGLGM